MIVGLDVDGVIRDFVGSLTKQYKKIYPDHAIPEVNKWNVAEVFPIGKDINDFFLVDYPSEVFYDADMYKGAYNFVERLSENNEIVIITSQLNAAARYWTLMWLDKTGVTDIVEHVCFIGEGKFNKHFIRVECLIDDNPDNLLLASKSGIMPIGIRRTWNDGKWYRLFDTYDDVIEFVNRGNISKN